jgi:hypothetical protein
MIEKKKGLTGDEDARVLRKQCCYFGHLMPRGREDSGPHWVVMAHDRTTPEIEHGMKRGGSKASSSGWDFPDVGGVGFK